MPQWAQLLPSIPRLAHRALVAAGERREERVEDRLLARMVAEQRRIRLALWVASALLAALVAIEAWRTFG
jgi:hypothetical protein